MKKMILVLMALSCGGCHSLSRISGSSSEPPKDQHLTAPALPIVQLPIITGYKPIQYSAWMPSDGQILLEANRPYMATWIFEGGNWNRYPIPYQQGARSIIYDDPTGMLKYTGFSTLDYYLLYQWIPN